MDTTMAHLFPMATLAEPEPEPTLGEHVVLVAFQVAGLDQLEAADGLMDFLPRPSRRRVRDMRAGEVIAWWVAEDDRPDGSDCSSAVFLPAPPCDADVDDGFLTQAQAEEILRHAHRLGFTDAVEALRRTVA